MKKFVFILFLLFLMLNSSAQTYWQANIQPVDSSGYYNIELGQDVIGVSQNSIALTDLRIIDGKGKEVPYFLRSTNPIQEVSHFEDYQLKVNTVKDSLNIVIVDNNKAKNINRFYIVIRNADVSKYASIRGSNDEKQWYIVKQKTAISGFDYKANENHEMLILDFPQGNYKYYEITLSNNQSSPLEILKIGKIKNSSIYGQFTELDLGKFVQKDSIDKKTYISFVNLANTYRFNKLEFVVKNKADYYRYTLLIDSIYSNSEGFNLSSKGDNRFFISDYMFSPNSRIVIENQNNPPLTIDSVRAYGLNRYLCAYLEKGQAYHLEIGKTDNINVEYDIEHFKNDIPSDLPVIKTTSSQKIVIPYNVRESLFIENSIFLWGIIILLALFLTFICVKMIKEVKNRK